MPKTTPLSFNPADYAMVADRITLFYEKYPEGRIITRLISRDREVVFRAAVYRDQDQKSPAATGWASEKENDGDVNTVACLENTETSAIGRALANLGFTASKKRPSYEEMKKVERARANRNTEQTRDAETPQIPASRERLKAVREDLVQVLAEADHLGFPRERSEAIRSVMRTSNPSEIATLEKMETAIRTWLKQKSVTG